MSVSPNLPPHSAPLLGTTRLWEHVLQGDDDARNELFRRYAERLVGQAQRQMSEPLRRKVDPEDVVHSVLKSLFVGAEQGRIAWLGPGELWSLLGMRVYYKVLEKARQKGLQQVSLEQLASEQRTTEPEPEEVASLHDTLADLKAHFPNPRHLQVIEFLLAGDTPAEISPKVGLGQARVRQLRSQAVEWLQARLTSDKAQPDSPAVPEAP